MHTHSKSLLQIHLAVFLFGLSGLFGKLIALPASLIVLGRVIFSSLFLIFILLYLRQDIKLKSTKDYLVLSFMGILLAIHWTTFFYAIQVSTVAIGLITFSTFPIFVTFLEPYFFKEKLHKADTLLAFVTFIGILFVIPSFELSNQLTQGALFGVISAITYAILSMLNRKYVSSYKSLVISFYEQSIAALFLIPIVFLQPTPVSLKDIGLLIVLGVVFTAISHSLFINGLKGVRTQTASIISNLEPIYGILLAALLLDQLPTGREILGGVIILITTLGTTFSKKLSKDKISTP